MLLFLDNNKGKLFVENVHGVEASKQEIEANRALRHCESDSTNQNE